MERAVSSTYLWCPFAGRGQLVPPPLAGRAVAGFLILSPSPQIAIIEAYVGVGTIMAAVVHLGPDVWRRRIAVRLGQWRRLARLSPASPLSLQLVVPPAVRELAPTLPTGCTFLDGMLTRVPHKPSCSTSTAAATLAYGEPTRPATFGRRRQRVRQRQQAEPTEAAPTAGATTPPAPAPERERRKLAVTTARICRPTNVISDAGSRGSALANRALICPRSGCGRHSQRQAGDPEGRGLYCCDQCAVLEGHSTRCNRVYSRGQPTEPPPDDDAHPHGPGSTHGWVSPHPSVAELLDDPRAPARGAIPEVLEPPVPPPAAIPPATATITSNTSARPQFDPHGNGVRIGESSVPAPSQGMPTATTGTAQPAQPLHPLLARLMVRLVRAADVSDAEHEALHTRYGTWRDEALAAPLRAVVEAADETNSRYDAMYGEPVSAHPDLPELTQPLDPAMARLLARLVEDDGYVTDSERHNLRTLLPLLRVHCRAWDYATPTPQTEPAGPAGDNDEADAQYEFTFGESARAYLSVWRKTADYHLIRLLRRMRLRNKFLSPKCAPDLGDVDTYFFFEKIIRSEIRICVTVT